MLTLYRFLLLLVVLLVPGFAEAEIRLTPAVKKGDPGTEHLCFPKERGDLCLMDRKNANHYCMSQGWVLPTVREYAGFLHEENGIKGVVEKWVSGEGIIITSINRIGDEDDFYFSASGYLRSRWKDGFSSFWTSSFHRGTPRNFYVWNSESAGISSVYGEYAEVAVKCLMPSR